MPKAKVEDKFDVLREKLSEEGIRLQCLWSVKGPSKGTTVCSYLVVGERTEGMETHMVVVHTGEGGYETFYPEGGLNIEKDVERILGRKSP